MTNKRSRKASKKFVPAAWQWDASLLSEQFFKIQMWSKDGACSLVSLETARKLVKAKAYFMGSATHICQVHEMIDCANA
jgi:hypothetical protein